MSIVDIKTSVCQLLNKMSVSPTLKVTITCWVRRIYLAPTVTATVNIFAVVNQKLASLSHKNV